MPDQFILSFGNSAMSFGGASAGWEPPAPPYTPTKPYLIFEFSAAGFTPNSGGGVTTTSAFGTWTQISDSPNRWYWESEFVASSLFPDEGGWPLAFCRDSQSYAGRLVPDRLGGGTCKIIGSGNLTADISPMTSLDRTFCNCTGLTSVSTILTPSTLVNVGGCFQGCTEMTDGTLDQYNYWSTYGTNISNHSATFKDAGTNTTTGLAELNQIPVGWGGNLVPASILLLSTRRKWKTNYDTWEIYPNDAPNWANVSSGMYLFTTSSVSAYAGVSMNRSRIAKFNGLVTTQSTSALYFYPCFMQHTSSAITWAVTTDSPNDSLAVGASNRDMPGTLDYSTYGPFTYEFGTYDSSGTVAATVYFCFLVTNSPISSSFSLADPYGVLYNGNFNVDGGFRYFF